MLWLARAASLVAWGAVCGPRAWPGHVRASLGRALGTDRVRVWPRSTTRGPHGGWSRRVRSTYCLKLLVLEFAAGGKTALSLACRLGERAVAHPFSVALTVPIVNQELRKNFKIKSETTGYVQEGDDYAWEFLSATAVPFCLFTLG